ncbi:hypothetical protein AA313_de0207901 [Arthrobotrys entomopaga]|nr:hypothetical protein AA313_de0207901 [Arthrobotrys entomopaga]
MSSNLSEDDIFYLTLTCYYWGSSSKYFVNQPTSEAIKALAQFYTTNPSADDDQVANYFGWNSKTYSVMEENFGPFNETVSAVDLLPLAPHPRATGSIIPLFVVFTILSTLVIALRFWSRISLLGRIQSFDWIASFSYLLIVAWGAYGVHASVVGGDMASWCDRSYHQIKQQSILTLDFACIAGAIRLKAVEDSIRFGISGKDSVLPIIAWGIVELNLGLICSSAPALRALVMRHIPKILSYGSGNSSAGSNGSAAGSHVHMVRSRGSASQSRVGVAASREKFMKSPNVGYMEYEKPDSPTSTTSMELPIQRGSKAVTLV